jgi:hypothetical protein
MLKNTKKFMGFKTVFIFSLSLIVTEKLAGPGSVYRGLGIV